MKKIFLTVACAAALSAFADYNDIKPGATKESAPTAVDWENANDPKLAAMTDEDVLADIVADDVSARALLAQVKGAYATDPFVFCQIGAVSQWVMQPEPCWLCFWSPSPAAGRKVWIDALLVAAEGASDTYVKMVCLDQLRWCGCDCPCVIRRIKGIGDKGDKSVKDFSEMVVRELMGKSIGL